MNPAAPSVAVFGLGYVGCVSAACLSEAGHAVVGIDVSDAKVAAINTGRATIHEPGIDERVRASVAAGRLRATRDTAEAVRTSVISMVCVGTPGRPGGAA